jgi:hypothetical protein
VRPLAIDLFCGLGGWTEGLMAEAYRVVGFDIERHIYGESKYPAQLVLQDVLTIHGSQFRDAALIVASPPCQAYSYRAMPWKRAKALPPPDNSLFEACFRIQREACEASGRYIPLVVENVWGAQKWVGRARWHFGSFYLWGDVPALMPMTKAHRKGPKNGTGNQLCAVRVDQIEREDIKNTGGSWFAVAHNTTSGEGRNPTKRNDPRDVIGAASEGRKGYASGTGNLGKSIVSRTTSSGSSARKAASAHIAKIPMSLARWIARVWHPDTA